MNFKKMYKFQTLIKDYSYPLNFNKSTKIYHFHEFL